MAATLLHPVPHHHLSVRLGMWMLSWLGSPLQQHSSLDEAAARHCNLTSPPGKKEKKKKLLFKGTLCQGQVTPLFPHMCPNPP